MNPYPAYKASGIEWIGEIPAHWDECKLKHIADLQSGSTITAEQLSPASQYPVFGGNGVRGHFTDYTHDGTFALIGRQGANCGNVQFATGKFWASEHAVVVSTLSVDMSFLAKLLDAMNLGQYSVAAAQPGLAVETIQNLKIPLPPPAEQIAIAAYLDQKTAQLDRLLEAKRQQIALLKEERTALVNAVVTKGLDPDAPMKASGIPWIGQIPAHWEVRRLATLGDFSKGGGISKADLTPTGAQAIVYGDIYTKYDVATESLINRIPAEIAQKARPIEKGCILFAGSGETMEDIGKSIVYLGMETAYAGGDIIIFKGPNFNHLFLGIALDATYIRQQKAITGKGEIVVHTYASALRDLQVVLPPELEQTKIADFVTTQQKKTITLIQKLEQEIILLQEYRKALISEVVTGKVKVPETYSSTLQHAIEVQP